MVNCGVKRRDDIRGIILHGTVSSAEVISLLIFVGYV